MERWEKDWESYLVLHIDFSLTKYMELTDLTGQLISSCTGGKRFMERMKRKRPLPSVCKASF